MPDISNAQLDTTQDPYLGIVTPHFHKGPDAPKVSYNDLLNKPSVVTDPGTNGIMVRTTVQTVVTRSLTAGSSKVAVTNADGTAGNPTVDVTEANLTLNNMTGPLNVNKGGTGLATLPAHNVLTGNGTSTVNSVAPSTSGNVLTSNGTDWVSSTPASTGLNFMQQKIGFDFTSGTTNVTRVNQVSCTAPNGGADSSNPFYMFFNQSQGSAPRIKKCIIDSVTTLINSNTSFTPTTTPDSGTKMYGTILGSYLYVTFVSGAAFVLKRYDLGTLANETTMTISGTVPGGGIYSIFNDGTYLYIANGGSTWNRFSVSGTTATNVAYTVTLSGANCANTTWCDGTNVHLITNATYKKFLLSSFALLASDSTHDFAGQTSLGIADVGGFGLSSTVMAEMIVGADMNDVGNSVGNVYAIMNPIKRL